MGGKKMFDTYIANESDTLESIANKFNTTENILEIINGNNINIKDGTNILLPKI